jgi:hypothetical protein
MITQFAITLFLGTQLLTISDHYLPEWVTLFKQYPILNQGTIEGVKYQFEKYSKEPHCAVLICETADHILTGLITGIPLSAYYFDQVEFFKKNNINPNQYYLINDLAVSLQNQNQGIGSKLYKRLIKKVVKPLGYKKICVCTIDHEEQHPLKPSHYTDSSLFWKCKGFAMTSIKIKESWPTLINNQGDSEMREHTLTLYIKNLEKENS